MCASLFQILSISSQTMNMKMDDLNNTSNSIANVNTTGYKNTRLNFQELLNETSLAGIKTSSSQLLLNQGDLLSTGVSTDLAINGNGFFTITLPDGTTGYTRDGSFQLDKNNRLLTSDGNPVVIQGTIPATASEVTVDENGTIFALVDDEWVSSGTIQLTRFTNPGALINNGDNILIASKNSGTAQTGTPGSTNFGKIESGSLESSNVNLSDEIVHLITVQRSFQLASKAFQTTSDMIESAIRLRKV